MPRDDIPATTPAHRRRPTRGRGPRRLTQTPADRAPDSRRGGAGWRIRGPRRLGGVLAAVVLVAAGGGLVSATALTPQGPGSSRPLAAPLAAVPAGSSVGVCPGPARLLEGAPVGTDPQFSPESATAKSDVSAVVLGSSAGVLPGSRLASLTGSTLVELAKAAPASESPPRPPARPAAAAPLAGVVSQQGVDDVSVLSADAQADRQASAGAVMRYTAEDGDLRGSAAAACQQPGNDLWLVGANTALGRTAVLNLSNASSSPATVSLELFGAKGPDPGPGQPRTPRGAGHHPLRHPGRARPGAGTAQRPGAQRRRAGGRRHPAERAAGAHARRSRVHRPGRRAGPAPGDLRRRHPGSGRRWRTSPAKSGFADAGPALQITVPGTADAVVAIKLFGRDGQKALPGGGVVTAKAGSVTEVPLAGVPAGPYTVAASSDVSFTAAARVTRGLKADEASDFAWSPASARLGSQHVVPVPRRGSALPRSSAPPRAGRRFPTRRSRPTARSARPRPPTSPAAPQPPSRSRPTSGAHRSSATSCPPRGIPPTAPSCCSRTAGRTSPRSPLPPGQRARSRSRSRSATDRPPAGRS